MTYRLLHMIISVCLQATRLWRLTGNVVKKLLKTRIGCQCNARRFSWIWITLLFLSFFNVPMVAAAINLKPVANAGAGQTVSLHTLVSLDGSKSTDSDGKIIKFLWSQIKGPKVKLNHASTAKASFISPDTLKIIKQQRWFSGSR